MQGLLNWLSALPPFTLYLIMGIAAMVENFFPPLPSDTVIAFGAFLAARGNGSIAGAFVATWIGNLTGASVMYGAGRRYGARRMEQRLLGAKGDQAESKLETLYKRYGMSALFLSRFIPAVRALVPPFAGAFRLPFIRSLVVMGVASGIWYGLVSYLAFRVGANWEGLQHAIGTSGKIAAIAALVIILGFVLIRVLGRRRS